MNSEKEVQKKFSEMTPKEQDRYRTGVRQLAEFVQEQKAKLIHIMKKEKD
jgi:hypothetical protein